MFIETVPNRTSPPAVLLRESFRDEHGRAQKRTLANLSKLPGDVIDGLKALLKGGTVIGTGPHEMRMERSLPHGHVAAALGMLRRIALNRLILSTARDAASRRHCDLVVAMVVDRLITPRSKLGFVRAVDQETATSSLGAVLRLGEVKEREAYEALDWLLEHQQRIENGLARRHLQDGVLVLYDVSSSYFEGRCCPLAQHGYSRDHRGDRPQIVYGLLCTRDGLPVAVEVFDGNTADPATLSSQVEKLKDRFGINRVVLVGDRGMITSARIDADLKAAGVDWITCLRAPAIQALAAENGPLQLSLFDERDLAEISAPEMFPGERLIVCRNRELAAERARKREELLAATERELLRIQAQVRRRNSPLRSAAEIGLAVGGVVNSRKMAKHFAVAIRDGHFAFQRRTQQIEQEARLDGIYVIRTSVPAEQLDANEAVQAYKDLSRVERAFRSLKTVDLEIGYQRDTRSVGHTSTLGPQPKWGEDQPTRVRTIRAVAGSRATAWPGIAGRCSCIQPRFSRRFGSRPACRRTRWPTSGFRARTRCCRHPSWWERRRRPASPRPAWAPRRLAACAACRASR